MAAWASLVQFPFSAPIYFCYVAPLAVVAAAAARMRVLRTRGWRWALGFAAPGLCGGDDERGYIYTLGQEHAPQALAVGLRLPRAHLR
jgi:hypothetical protein